MENQNRNDVTQMILAAQAIQKRLKLIAQDNNMVLKQFIWNGGEGIRITGPQRLNLHIDGVSINAFFTNEELVSYWNQMNLTQTDTRLHRLIDDIRDTMDHVAFIDQAKHPWGTEREKQGGSPNASKGSRNGGKPYI